MLQQCLPVKFSEMADNHIRVGQILFVVEAVAEADTEHFRPFSGKDAIFGIFNGDTSVWLYTQTFGGEQIDGG